MPVVVMLMVTVVLVSLFCLSGIKAAASSYLHFDQALMVNCVQKEIKGKGYVPKYGKYNSKRKFEESELTLEGWQMLWEAAGGEVQVLGGAGQCKWRWRGRCMRIARKGDCDTSMA